MAKALFSTIKYERIIVAISLSIIVYFQLPKNVIFELTTQYSSAKTERILELYELSSSNVGRSILAEHFRDISQAKRWYPLSHEPSSILPYLSDRALSTIPAKPELLSLKNDPAIRSKLYASEKESYFLSIFLEYRQEVSHIIS